MVILENGMIFNHCFCYMSSGVTCERTDCTGKQPLRGELRYEKMTLCQYYDLRVQEMGYRSWNHYCEEQKGQTNLEWLKKQWKKEYKNEEAKHVPTRFQEVFQESESYPSEEQT